MRIICIEWNCRVSERRGIFEEDAVYLGKTDIGKADIEVDLKVILKTD